jgi:hypothetical protein
MSTSTSIAATQPNTYLEKDLQRFQHLDGVNSHSKQAAEDCLSCLPRSEMAEGDHTRTTNKLRLARSSANTVNVTAKDELRTYAAQCNLRKLGAILVNKSMNEIYRSRLETEHNFDWKNGFRIPGPRDGDSLSNNTFVSPLPNNLYRALTFNDQGEASEMIIGEEGLNDRLGEEPTAAELTKREKPCGSMSAEIEKTLVWVRSQPEGSFCGTQGVDNTVTYSKAASELCILMSLAGMHSAPKGMRRIRASMLDSNFNHSFRWPGRERETRKGVYESIATDLVARAVLSHLSCGKAARDLLSIRPDCSGAMLLDFETVGEGKVNMARSHWAFPSAFQTTQSPDPMHHFYDSVKFHDGTVKVREVTAGGLVGMWTGTGNSGKTSLSEARSTAGSVGEDPKVSQAKRRRIGK